MWDSSSWTRWGWWRSRLASPILTLAGTTGRRSMARWPSIRPTRYRWTMSLGRGIAGWSTHTHMGSSAERCSSSAMISRRMLGTSQCRGSSKVGIQRKQRTRRRPSCLALSGIVTLRSMDHSRYLLIQFSGKRWNFFFVCFWWLYNL